MHWVPVVNAHFRNPLAANVSHSDVHLDLKTGKSLFKYATTPYPLPSSEIFSMARTFIEETVSILEKYGKPKSLIKVVKIFFN